MYRGITEPRLVGYRLAPGRRRCRDGGEVTTSGSDDSEEDVKELYGRKDDGVPETLPTRNIDLTGR